MARKPFWMGGEKRPTIELWRGPNAWLAKFSDPSIKETFGTDTLPTTYTPLAPPRTVIDDLIARNPGVDVWVRCDSGGKILIS